MYRCHYGLRFSENALHEVKAFAEMGNSIWFHSGRACILLQEMEGSPEKPILLNPFRRGVSPKIRNKDDFPSLEME